jgi:iron complex outermembrane receptor protein
MKFIKNTVLFLIFSTSIYAAEETNVQKFDDIIISAPIVTEIENATVLTGDNLRIKLGSTLGETLQNELGITNQSFGAGVGAPVIRGQSGSRVKVMQNDLGNNDVSSLSPDHANGVEPINVERIEILRGADTLRYGSGAIGGVVNVLDGRIPEKLFDKIIGGAAEQRFDSATTETSSALKVEGSRNNLAYHLDGFWRDSENTHIGGTAIDESAVRKHDPSFNILPIGELQNTHGFIGNTSARSQGGAAGLSWIESENFAGAAINILDKFYGIPPDGHGEKPVNIQLNQTKYDFKGQFAKPFTGVEKVNFKFGYTDYKHVELDGNVAGTTFLNQAYENRVTLNHAPIANWKGTMGLQTNHSDFQALGEEGEIVPKTQSQNYSVFAIEKLSVGHLNYEFGGRAELQKLSPKQLQSINFVPLSGAATVSWDMTDAQQWRLSFTHSQRAPQIQELFSDGFHHATRSYEVGNANLKKELSNNLDLGYQFDASWMQADFNFFHNWVNDYIYQQRDSSQLFDAENENFVAKNVACSNCFPLLHSQQQAAIFKGFEAKTVFPLFDNKYGTVDLTLFGDYTRGTFDKGGDVPRMPPLRYGTQLSYEKNNFSGNVRLTRGEAQINSGENETTTPAYLLLNIGTQYKIASFAKSEILLFAKGKNLLDENIRSSVSYVRNFAPEAGRSAEVGIRVSY